MKTLLFIALVIFGTFVTSVAQTGNRFPAPLGIDRVLSGVVEKAHRSPQVPNSRPSRYRLHSGDVSYALHGHETQLKKLVGKQVRVTGHVVGDDVDIQSVELQQAKD